MGRPAPRTGYRYSHFIFRAPRPARSVLYILAACIGSAALLWFPSEATGLLLSGLLLAFLVPALVAGFATGPLAALLGGRLELHRSLLVVLTVLVLVLPIVGVWRIIDTFAPTWAPAIPVILLFIQGPTLWFRVMSLLGVSRPNYPRSMPPALLQPLLAILGIFLLYPPNSNLVLAAAIILLLGFLCAALLLRTADRPLQREFGISGVSLMRPLLDHVNERSPSATEILESFFRSYALPANLEVTLIAFFSGGKAKATIALPTVHPGPFAALGGSDLPRKLAEQLGPAAGVVFVPHTPCDHDLDLPSKDEVERIGAASRAAFQTLRPVAPTMSPLVTPYEGSFARAQMLGDTAVVVVTQAPEPTDDIAFSVADRIARAFRERPGAPSIVLIDAHNSYVEGKGDLTYGTPAADKLVRDVEAAVESAQAQEKPSDLKVGVAVRDAYRIGTHGIGPHGIRALVVQAAFTTTAYVLIDGNNLLRGHRAPILERLRPLVDAAEVMTTDNHVVHEVDGGTNSVGERLSATELAKDVGEVVEEALRNLSPADVRVSAQEIPGIHVLGPTFTDRLLTALGDTVSVFSNALLTTFLLLLATSLVVVLALR